MGFESLFCLPIFLLVRDISPGYSSRKAEAYLVTGQAGRGFSAQPFFSPTHRAIPRYRRDGIQEKCRSSYHRHYNPFDWLPKCS